MHDTQGWGDVILQDRLHSLHGVLNETAWHVIWRWQPDIYLFYHYYYFWRLWTGTLQVVCRPLLCRADWYAWWGSGGFVGPGEQWWLLSWPHLVLMQNWASLYLYLPTLHLLGCKYVPLTWISPNAALVQSWTFCTILMRKHPLIIWIQPTLGTLQENTSTLLYKLKQLTVNSTAYYSVSWMLNDPDDGIVSMSTKWRFCWYTSKHAHNHQGHFSSQKVQHVFARWRMLCWNGDIIFDRF